jgi:tetratricopeptide (TPR) repeat protein
MSDPKPPQHAPVGESYYDLGTYARTSSTQSPEARLWFDRGLRWMYAFNHEAAIECFEAAVANDDDFALAHWGIAYSLGPNYNKPWGFFDEKELQSVIERTRSEALKAKRAVEKTPSPVDEALVDALQYRYQTDKAPADCSIWNADFAEAMRKAYMAHGDDLDVEALFADSLMNLTPWDLWDLRSGRPKDGAKTFEAKEVLEKAFKQPGGLEHPGLLHLYIHLMEQSPKPSDALPIASRLRGLLPDAGHLNHMPTHLDILCGDYTKAAEWNTTAIVADNKYLARVGPLNFYSLYRCHDYHFKIYAAMFAGQYEVAITTVTEMEETMPDDLMRIESPPMADWMESALSFRYHIFVRFGKWQEVIDWKLPSDPDLYCFTTAMAQYAKGIAYAATGRIDQAVEQREKFRQAAANVPESRMLFNNKCKDLCNIAAAMLDGEVEYRKSNFEAAFGHLRQAIEYDDSLPYDEPWGWMQPTRHAYGALLLEQGRVWEAATVYKADLGHDETLPRALQHPNNVWSLHGLSECLVRLGKEEEVKAIRPKLEAALEVADVPIKSSCFCRLHVPGAADG